jgi:hypothetical protein
VGPKVITVGVAFVVLVVTVRAYPHLADFEVTG